MCIETANFFSEVIGAGAILTGLCGTFFAFRIQRESTFYSQPYRKKDGTWEVSLIDRTHCTAPFRLLCWAFFASLCFGLCIPLLGMVGIKHPLVTPFVVTVGLFVAIILLIFYVLAELLHYHLFKCNSKITEEKTEEDRCSNDLGNLFKRNSKNTEKEIEEDKRSKDIGCSLLKLAAICISLVVLLAYFY